MRSICRTLPVLGLALTLVAAPVLAQGPAAAPAMSNPWSLFEEELGLQTTYSVDMQISTMGMTVDSRIIRNGDRIRTEMIMPFMNLQTIGLEIPEDGQPASYLLFPDQKKYVRNDEDPATPAGTPRIEELGTATHQGVECIQRRITLEHDGFTSRIDVLFSPAQQDMPVHMAIQAEIPMGNGQPAMPVESTVVFQNYDFSVPPDQSFVIPADYAKAGDIMEILMSNSDGLGGLMQQMPGMPFEE